jgi:hypothetical protein
MCLLVVKKFHVGEGVVMHGITVTSLTQKFNKNGMLRFIITPRVESGNCDALQVSRHWHRRKQKSLRRRVDRSRRQHIPAHRRARDLLTEARRQRPDAEVARSRSGGLDHDGQPAE